MINKVIKSTRTVRRYVESDRISSSTLKELIDLARFAGSARNCQPWQYILINIEEDCEQIFPNLLWAGYLKDWSGPAKGEQPAAYIVCVLNHDWLKGSVKEAYFDLGISSQNILLGSTEKGIKGCRIAAIKPELHNLFSLSEHQSIELVIALGKPSEEVVMVDGLENDNIAYWRDSEKVHYVPKRKLEDIIIATTILDK